MGEQRVNETQPPKLVFANSQADLDAFMARVTDGVNNLASEVAAIAYKRGYDAAEAQYKQQIEDLEERIRDYETTLYERGEM